MYHPKTGLCIEGPCTGASLHPLNIEITDGEIHLVDLQTE
jgi:nitrite reductase/ring-hydroxylating ferredoxin subunit